jgi:hypothetical protein
MEICTLKHKKKTLQCGAYGVLDLAVHREALQERAPLRLFSAARCGQLLTTASLVKNPSHENRIESIV